MGKSFLGVDDGEEGQASRSSAVQTKPGTGQPPPLLFPTTQYRGPTNSRRVRGLEGLGPLLPEGGVAVGFPSASSRGAQLPLSGRLRRGKTPTRREKESQNRLCQ